MIGLLKPLIQQEKIEIVVREYGLHPHRIENIGKVQKLHTQRGNFALKKMQTEPQQVEFVQRIISKLGEKQYSQLLFPVCNQFGDSFIQIGGDTYYLTPWVEDKIEFKYRADWEEKMLMALAHLHSLSIDTGIERNTPHSLPTTRLIDRWSSRLKKMEEVRSFAQDRELQSPVEAIFLTHFDYLTELSQRAIDYLKQWEDKADLSKSSQTVLCHGHVYRNHVLQSKENQFYLINFDYASFDSPAKDLALFFRRHQETAFGAEGVAIEWLAKYEEAFQLARADKILLAIFLLFPERVFKEMENYYQAIRSWHPLKHAKYLEKLIKATGPIRRFVKEMLAQEVHE
ncbi:phosphotransferase [Bacillus horti]|uniref:Spore coat protein YsxE n=1 Tax=Caldalkalibacillus horti TaxID=77523 RepID=A0ABT9VTT7_9BACI|nr:phosphotransferase [Bacillus horti]MDQ0164300.1 spore coat protein YsxE [Bacillus horti]